MNIKVDKKTAGIHLTIYSHGRWNQKKSWVKNKYPICGAGGEKEVVSASSQASVRWHLNLLSLNQSP